MRGLYAALQKDIRLFFSGTGIAALLLPVLLFFALQTGMSNMAKDAYVAPFPIAVRDEDGTVMSRSLTSQMRQLDIFSEVIRAKEMQTDAQLLEEGAAAVVTIPKDYFYTMYSMNNAAVTVVLNENMPLQAQLLRSVLTSVMDIIGADQSTGRVVYRHLYGALNQQQEEKLWEETAGLLIQDALSRQQVFDTSPQADAQSALSRSLLACAISVLCLFFPLSAVKTIPEELHMGILPRFIAAGGSMLAFLLSKLLTAALLTLPSFLLLIFTFEARGWMLLILASAILFCAGFSLMLLLASLSKDAAATQRMGNMLLLLSLVLGGALYPMELLPAFVQRISLWTLPYYAGAAAQWAFSGMGVPGLLRQLLPVILMLFLFPLSILFIRFTENHRRKTATCAPGDHSWIAPGKKSSAGKVLLPVTALKLRGMSGGFLGIAAMALVCLLGGAVAATALGKTPDTLTIAVDIREQSPQTEDLAKMLQTRQGLTLVFTSAEEGREMLASGKAEGLLIIHKGYGAALTGNEKPNLLYESAASASSAMGAREIIAGQVSVQRIQLRGLQTLQARSGQTLSLQESNALLAEMQAEIAQLPALYTFTSLSGKAVSVNPYAPSPFGFALLAVMLTVFTWGAWVGRSDARRVEGRIAARRFGTALSYCSDACALLLAALISGAAAIFLTAPSPTETAALCTYIFCVTGLSLALVRFSALSGRMDILAPFLALITALLGGSFGDFTQFYPPLQMAAYFTPQGLALWASRGAYLPAGILLLFGTVFLWLGKPWQRR